MLVEGGRPTVRYDHWAAHNLGEHLVLGPEYTMRWVREQERVDDHANGGWLDELWSQGGLTMEPGRRRLVWYDMAGRLDLRRRRVVAALLARTWAGWTVEWAHHGISDLAAAAGVPRERVRNPDIANLIEATEPQDVALREDPPGTGRWVPDDDELDTDDDELDADLVTVAGGGDLAVALVRHACHAAWVGSVLVARVLAGPGATAGTAVGVHLGSHQPSGGVHVDLDARRVSYWCTSGTHGLGDRMHEKWGPDIEPVFLQDRFAEHLALTGGFVTADPPDLAAELAAFLGDVAGTHATGQVHPAISALDALESVVGALPSGRVRSAVNPAIADHHPVAATAEELAAVVAHGAELMAFYRTGR